MRNVRRTETYQAIAIDLALLGVITKEECEMLLDGGIPSGITLPDGKWFSLNHIKDSREMINLYNKSFQGMHELEAY